MTERRTCILKVPSLSVPGDAHFLVNPAHPDFELLFVRPSQSWSDFTGYEEEESDRLIAMSRSGQQGGIKSIEEDPR